MHLNPCKHSRAFLSWALGRDPVTVHSPCSQGMPSCLPRRSRSQPGARRRFGDRREEEGLRGSGAQEHSRRPCELTFPTASSFSAFSMRSALQRALPPQDSYQWSGDEPWAHWAIKGLHLTQKSQMGAGESNSASRSENSHGQVAGST